MLTLGDVHIFVTDFHVGLRFWADGLGLRIVEQEIGDSSSFATLEFPDEGPALHLISGAEPWADGERPAVGTRPTVRFDVLTSRFDETLVRLIEQGGRQVDEIEKYNDLRVVTIADPDGNSFELLEVPEEADDNEGNGRAQS